jgi:hypothetical protein
MAHFCVKAEHVILGGESSLQVKFDMAFAHKMLTDDPGLADPIWLRVESITNEHISTCSSGPTTCANELEMSLKRQLEPCSTPVAKEAKKSMRFASSISASMPTRIPPLSATTLILEDSVRGDFCYHLQNLFRQPLQANARVVLENTSECKQLVYPTTSSESRKATSLAQLITSTNTPGLAGGILLHERVCLAKTLAIAVLQYHATPWLQLSWRSTDVLFYGEGDMQMQKNPNLSTPYVNASIRGECAQIASQPQSAMARNPILFSLGVAFIEIAHAASLESLELPSDADNGQLHREFFTARRLAKSKRTVMGSTYNDIVEQLVECVFPCGDDLTNPELQAAFYENVICPLNELEQELEQGFRELWLGGTYT